MLALSYDEHMDNVSKPKRSAVSQFGETAANYRISKPHSQGESLDVLALFVAKDNRHFKIGVDIATGAGFAAFASAAHTDLMLATDPTPAMLQQVHNIKAEREVKNVVTMMVIAENLPFANNSIDLVTCRVAPHHFLDVPLWLSEVQRILKPHGVFVLADTSAPEDQEIATWMNALELKRDPSHIRNWTPSEWEEGINKTGLKVTDSALAKVNHECNDWTKRSNSTNQVAAEIQETIRNASEQIKTTFGIEETDDGKLTWYWDVSVLRAEKV